MIQPTTKIIKKIAFFGDAQATSQQDHYQDAYKVAKLLAQNGYTIVNGGGPGVMLASTLGAKEGGGKVELVVIDPQKEPQNYEGEYQQNIKLADQIHQTSDYPKRLNKLVEISDAFVIFRGGTGTLSELGLVWEMAKFEYGHHEPLIFYGDFWQDIITPLITRLHFDSKEKGVYQIVNQPSKVLQILKNI